MAAVDHDRDLFDADIENVENLMRDFYLSFEIENEYFAINVLNVIEIISMNKITPVPELPPYIKGVINLRGEVIPIIDVRTRFEKPEIEVTESTCIIQIKYDGYDLGLIVDKVIGTLTIPEEQVAPPPSAKLRVANRFIRNIGRVGDDVYLLVDLQNLIK